MRRTQPRRRLKSVPRPFPNALVSVRPSPFWISQADATLQICGPKFLAAPSLSLPFRLNNCAPRGCTPVANLFNAFPELLWMWNPPVSLQAHFGQRRLRPQSDGIPFWIPSIGCRFVPTPWRERFLPEIRRLTPIINLSGFLIRFQIFPWDNLLVSI